MTAGEGAGMTAGGLAGMTAGGDAPLAPSLLTDGYPPAFLPSFRATDVKRLHGRSSAESIPSRPDKPSPPSFRTSFMRNPSGRFQDEDGCPMKDVGHDGGEDAGMMAGIQIAQIQTLVR